MILGYSEFLLADSESPLLREKTRHRLKVTSEMAARASKALRRLQRKGAVDVP